MKNILLLSPISILPMHDSNGSLHLIIESIEEELAMMNKLQQEQLAEEKWKKKKNFIGTRLWIVCFEYSFDLFYTSP
jgi:hypothetical protein